MGNSALDKTNFAASDLILPGQVAEDVAVFDGANWLPQAPINGYQYIKRANIDRNRATASNTVVYTGFGFAPKLIFCNAHIVTETTVPHSSSQSAKVGATQGVTSIAYDGNTSAYSSGSSFGVVRKSGGDSTGVTLTSMDSDGITLAYEQIGVVTGEMRMQYVALG